ncbi:MAG: hypothetical protein ACYC21_15125, partial [Eubacteriales bacterium]
NQSILPSTALEHKKPPSQKKRRYFIDVIFSLPHNIPFQVVLYPQCIKECFRQYCAHRRTTYFATPTGGWLRLRALPRKNEALQELNFSPSIRNFLTKAARSGEGADSPRDVEPPGQVHVSAQMLNVAPLREA